MHSILPDRELRAWIRLSQEPGLGPAQARGLLAAVGLPHDIFALSASSLAKFVPHDLARQLSLPAHENNEMALAATLEWLGAPEHHIVTLADPGRSEVRRVGKECVTTGRFRWSPIHYKQKHIYNNIYNSTQHY